MSSVLEAIERLNRLEKLVLPDLSQALVRIQGGNLGIKTKSNDKDLVTVADVESENRLTSFIREHWPEDSILAEETGGSIGRDLTWIIDPVDGTVNYAHGLPLYSVSVGIALDGKPVAGIVHMPSLGTTYKGAVGHGATKNGNPIRVSETNAASQALVVTGFPYDRATILEALIAGVESVLKNCRGIRRTGSASIDLCWLAEGSFDAHYECNLSPWDTCASEVILQEAGGRITTFAGEEHRLTDKTLLATNHLLHEAMLQIIAPLRSGL